VFPWLSLATSTNELMKADTSRRFHESLLPLGKISEFVITVSWRHAHRKTCLYEFSKTAGNPRCQAESDMKPKYSSFLRNRSVENRNKCCEWIDDRRVCEGVSGDRGL
jgi:hypothetical protein